MIKQFVVNFLEDLFELVGIACFIAAIIVWSMV